MEVFFIGKKQKTDLTKEEARAVAAGGARAGEYLESIGVTDLGRLSADQWNAFCTVLFEESCADLARQAKEQVPF